MLSINVDPKIVRILENLYNDTECAVVIDGQLTAWFEVHVGLRQGCLLSPTLFNIFLEFVMKEVKDVENTLNLTDSLSLDIRYADDTTLLSAIFDKLSLTTKQLDDACRKWGMKINGAKCKVLSPENTPIILDGNEVEHVQNFVFLGSSLPDTSGDVQRRISLAATAFGRLRKNIWNCRNISRNLKVRLFNALILPIATYASETWTLKQEDIRLLQSFEMRGLRAILGVSLRDRKSNISIRETLGIKYSIGDVIKNKRLKWFGHVVRRSDDSYVAKAYTQSFKNRRPPGRPPKRWSRQITDDLGIPLSTAERTARNRTEWRKASWQERARALNGLGT